LGLNIQGAAPTGTEKQPCYLFDAMVGNGKHGELGAGLHGHYTFWRGEEEDRSFSFLFDVNVTHMFKRRQCRTFDLACKPNSAYMLAAKFEANDAVEGALAVTSSVFQVGYADRTALITADQDPLDITTTPINTPNPSKRFANEYAPVANLSTVNVDVRIAAQTDLVAMFNYQCNNFSWDIGYDFWGRSCEKYDCIDSCNKGTICDSALKETWALKGDARMFGYQIVGNILAPANKVVKLSATQSEATIYSGLNKVSAANTEEVTDLNANVDSPQYAWARTPVGDTPANSGGPLGTRCVSNFDPTGTTRYGTLAADLPHVKTSQTPKFLSCSSLSMARTRGLSHSIFTHLSWTFDREDWVPYLGIGAAVEFGSSCSSCNSCDDCCNPCCNTTTNNSSSTTSTNNTCCNPCGPCIDCATSEWRVWVKGGLAFGNGS